MDVRERLETLREDERRPVPLADAHEVFRRGRRRRTRRVTLSAGGAVAAVIAVVVALPGIGPLGWPLIDDNVAGQPDPTDPTIEPTDGPTSPDGGEQLGGDIIEVGEVRLVVPDGVRLIRHTEAVAPPCHEGLTVPTIHLMEGGIFPDGEPPDCPARPATVSSIMLADASLVPPAYLPGHAMIEQPDFDEFELLGTTGLIEHWEDSRGMPMQTWWSGDLDLYLDVREPELTPDLVTDLLASATRIGDAPAPTGAPPLSGEASTERRELDEGGYDHVLVDVRVGTHDGFDRVTLELVGDSGAGWFAHYVDEPTQDGSGEPIDMDGDAYLMVVIRGVQWPPDWPDDLQDRGIMRESFGGPAGAGVLRQVLADIIFEGQQAVFIGLDAEVPFRIARFDDPQRIVLDLVHP